MFLSSLIILSLSYKLEVIKGKFEFESYATTLGFIPHTIKGYQENVEGVIVYEDEIKGEIRFPTFFNTGNTRRDRDVANILNFRNYPYIIIKPLNLKKDDAEKILGFRKGGILLPLTLKINGKEKTYEFEIFFEWVKSDVIKFQTEKIIKFTDFGIDPPSIKGLGFFGKIVTGARDELKIKGEVSFKVKKEE